MMAGTLWWDILGFIVTCGVSAAILYWNGWKEKRVTKSGIVLCLAIGILCVPSLFFVKGFALAMRLVWVAAWIGSGCLKIIRYPKRKTPMWDGGDSLGY